MRPIHPRSESAENRLAAIGGESGRADDEKAHLLPHFAFHGPSLPTATMVSPSMRNKPCQPPSQILVADACRLAQRVPASIYRSHFLDDQRLIIFGDIFEALAKGARGLADAGKCPLSRVEG